jgi:SAM-dependent methyltransferase
LTRKSSKKNWSYTLFVKHPELYLPILERDKAKSKKEAHQLDKLLRRYNVLPPSKILDYSCGIGRHAINLFRLGYEVVGYDPSPAYIRIAKRWTADLLGKENKIRFYNGEPTKASKLLSNNRDTGFNGVILMGACLGFSSEEEDIKMLRDVHSVAKDDCVLIIESENRDHTLEHFRPYINYNFKNLLICEEWKFDFETSVATGKCRYFQKHSNGKLSPLLDLITPIRLYSLHELRRLLNEGGWEYLKCYGNIMTIDKPDFNYEDVITVSVKE